MTIARLGVLVALVAALAGCASTPPPKPPAATKPATWELWTTATAEGSVIGTFDEAGCMRVRKELGAGRPCRHVHVTTDPSSAPIVLWLGRYQMPQKTGEGPQFMIGDATQEVCLLALERALKRGMILLTDCRQLGILDKP
jgi:hypothetical protein